MLNATNLFHSWVLWKVLKNTCLDPHTTNSMSVENKNKALLHYYAETPLWQGYIAEHRSHCEKAFGEKKDMAVRDTTQKTDKFFTFKSLTESRKF